MSHYSLVEKSLFSGNTLDIFSGNKIWKLVKSEAMNTERTEKCEMLKSELSQLALVLESNQVFAEPINPLTGEYLIRFVGEAKWFVSD